MLRKCMVLAHKLDSDLLEDWVTLELDGYPSEASVPAYRRIPMNFKINAMNMAWRVTGHNVPQLLVNDLARDDEFDILKYRPAIGTIDPGEIEKANGVLTVNLDNYSFMLIGKVFDSRMNITKFWGEVPPTQILGILDAVKNRVLKFVLTLQKEYPTADGVEGLKSEQQGVQQAVSQIFNTTINGGNANVVGTANKSTVTITVNQGNLQGLRQHLLDSGVALDDVLELEAALAEEPKIGADKQFGPMVRSWVGKMAVKAASGAWNIGIAAGTVLVEHALLGYYGYAG
ncbi:hypothetical protein [Rhizobium sp. B21/90]|nr:hypothetical protein [Rhizobium sp. B21/90]